MKKIGWFFVFCLILFLFSLLTTRVQFHDVYEYITVSKALAGVSNLDIYVTHSILYPFIISLFLRIFSNMFMIKFVNILILMLIGGVIYSQSKSKKSFFIFAFSPIVWYLSIQITPIILASLFLLLAYIFLNKEEKKYFVWSGVFLGLSVAIYTPMGIISFFFVLFYLWEKRLYQIMIYFVSMFVGLLPRLLLEMYFFGNPIYTFIRFFGARFIISVGLHEGASNFVFMNTLIGIIYLITISPFIYRLSFLTKIGEKKTFYFILISLSFLLITTPVIKYFFLLTPLIILMLGRTLNYKEIKIHMLISIIIIIILTFGFFGNTDDLIIKKDIKKIIEEHKVSQIIVEPYKADKIATYLWEASPKIIWFMNFELEDSNNILKEYGFDLNGGERIKTREIVEIGAKFKNKKEIYEDYIFISEGENKFCKNCDLEKCYDILCIYIPKK